MGCCWSCEDEDIDQIRRSHSVNNHYVRRTVPSIQRTTPSAPTFLRSYEAPQQPIRIYSGTTNKYVQPPLRTIQVRRTVVAVPKPAQVNNAKPEPLYGEFKCRCGHFWRSLLSWRNVYQVCKRCKAEVQPKNQRAVLPTDYTRDKNDAGEHPKELCEQCKRLGGRYCGRFNK